MSRSDLPDQKVALWDWKILHRASEDPFLGELMPKLCPAWH